MSFRRTDSFDEEKKTTTPQSPLKTLAMVGFRSGRDKETSGRKSWGSVDASASTSIGASPPVRSGGPEEQRSLASDDSLGPVSNMLLIPRMPPAQYEVSSSLGYTSNRGESTGRHAMDGWVAIRPS